MVKVLPEPVTPSSTWSRSPRLMPADQLVDRLRLVARRLELRMDGEALAALGRCAAGDHGWHGELR